MTTTTRALPHLAEIALPDFGMPGTEPVLPASLFAERLERLRSAMGARGYDHVVVWADREHSANLAYLSGFDPRFEEALLVLGTSGARRSSWATSARAWRPPRRCPCGS